MKNKYQRLSKEEKKECRNMYYNSVKGREMKIRLTRLWLIGTVGILLSLYWLGNGMIKNTLKWYDYCLSIPLILFSLIFLIGAFFKRQKVLNQFALKIPRFKNK